MLVITARVKVVVVMVSALAVAAGLLTLALLSQPAQAQAETDTFNQRIPIEGTLLNPCTGGIVTYEGTQHVVIHRTQDASGGFHFKFHASAHALGESASGAKYVAHRTQNDIDFFSESASNFTTTDTLQFIRQGSETPEDDFQAKITQHFTINANGELTSEVINQEEECK
jgi:hypothetical protein